MIVETRSVLGRIAILGLAGCAQATSGSDPEDIGRSSAALVSGTPSDANDGVGLLYFTTDYVCTGFLVSPNVVVTAAFCFNDGKTPTAFYTGAGAAVTTPTGVLTAPNLTKWNVASSGTYPGAVTQAAETGASAYTAMNDVAYVVLTDRVTATPIPYGGAATPGACVTEGYGRSGATVGTGDLGLRLAGTATLNGPLATTDALSVTGANLSNSGDFGAPLLCGGNAVAIFSAFRYDDANTIIENAYQPLNATITTWIDGLVTNNPPSDADAGAGAPDAAATGSGTDGGTSGGTSGGASTTSSSSSGAVERRTAAGGSPPPAGSSGCAVEAGANGPAFGWLVGIAALVAARSRRRRAHMG